jgi:4-hydroxy-3-methylbut-2-enyl diphosphate reductase
VIVEGQKYYRKGFKMRDDIQHLLDRDYRSEIVDKLRENGNVFTADNLTLHLANEFGFCYGVDRAVDYAFQTREKFPDKRIYITGDMIHNVSMNNRLRQMGIEFLSQGFDGHPDEKFDSLGPEDVVLLPAFGEAQGQGVHHRGHYLRLGPLCVEARRPLREKGLYQRHPRQVLPRGDESHRFPDL